MDLNMKTKTKTKDCICSKFKTQRELFNNVEVPLFIYEEIIYCFNCKKKLGDMDSYSKFVEIIIE